MTWSKKTESIFGLAPGSFAGTQAAFLACIHPEDRQLVEETIQTTLENCSPYHVETRIIRPDGTVAWVAYRGHISRDYAPARELQGYTSSPSEGEQSSQPLWMAGVVIDITERKQSEAALRDRESRLQLALNAAQMGTWDWNIATGEINCSEQTQSIFGFAPGTFPRTYEAYFNKVHPDDRNTLTEAVLRTFQDKTPYQVEHRILMTNGEVRWVAGHSNLMHTQSGEPLWMSGIIMDITDRKQAETELQAVKDQLQAVLDAVPGFVSWIDADLQYLGVNQHLATAFLLAPQAFVGKEVGTLESDVEFAPVMRQFFAGSDQAVSAVIEAKVNNCFRNYLMVAQKYQQGQAAVLVAIDITKCKQAESELRAY